MPCDGTPTPQLVVMKERLVKKRARMLAEGQDTSEIDALLDHIEEHLAQDNDEGRDADPITVDDSTAPDSEQKKKKRAKRALEREIHAT